MLSQRRISVILTCSFLRKFGVRTHANPKQEKGLAKLLQGDPDHEKISMYMATPQTYLYPLRAPPKRWQDLFYCGVSSVNAHPLWFFHPHGAPARRAIGDPWWLGASPQQMQIAWFRAKLRELEEVVVLADHAAGLVDRGRAVRVSDPLRAARHHRRRAAAGIPPSKVHPSPVKCKEKSGRRNPYRSEHKPGRLRREEERKHQMQMKFTLKM